MKLLTKEIENNFKKYGYLSQDGKGLDAKVLVKFFNPYGVGTWIITEAEWVEEANDWALYGYCSLGYGYEFGSVWFKELESLKVGPFGAYSIERDLYASNGKKVRDLISERDLM